jgi:uncharacterized protein (DUF58 family)
MPGLLSFLLILFVLAALLRVDFFFTIVYLLLIVYLLSRLWVRWMCRHLCITRRFADHAFHGDDVTVHLDVRNTGWLPVPWLAVHESLPVQLGAPAGYRQVFGLKPRERRQFQYTLACRKRGYYPVGPLSMETGDLLGVVDSGRMQLSLERLVVYPKVVPLRALNLPTRSPQAVLRARSPLFEDPTRIMGVRDYQRGDSPRRIHWTATASAGRLLVKQYQPAIARETLICLDLHREGYGQRQRYDASELAIVVAASLAHHIAVQEGLPVGLTTEALDPLVEDRVRFFLPPRRGRAHLIQVLEVLARAQIAEGAPLTELLRRGSADLAWGATIVAITGLESAQLFDNLVYLRRAGFAVSLILVRPGRPSAELQRRAGLANVPIHRVWDERDLGMWS